MKKLVDMFCKVARISFHNLNIMANDIRMKTAIEMYSPLLTTKEGEKYIEKFCEFTIVKNVIGGGYERFGRHYDGGYVMLDDFSDTSICYSFGINDDVSWDLAFANKNKEIFMYDHTINTLPVKNKHFHWSKLCVW